MQTVTPLQRRKEMYVRTLHGPNQGGLIELRRDGRSSVYHLIDPKHSLTSMGWVDGERVLLSTSDDRLLLVNLKTGATLASADHKGGSTFVVAKDGKSFWTTGGHICHYSLPDLVLKARYYGVRRSAGQTWELVLNHDEIPDLRDEETRYIDDFRQFPFIPAHWVALDGDVLVGTAPHRGKHSNDRQFQGTELAHIDTISGAVDILPTPGTRYTCSQDYLSVSPDGHYAVRVHPEPIAKQPTKKKLLGKFLTTKRDAATLSFNHARIPSILAQDDSTRDDTVAQISYPLEVWDIHSKPKLLGLVIPEWTGVAWSSREVDRELQSDLPDILSDMANAHPNLHERSYWAATNFNLSPEAFFEQVSVLNSLSSALLGDLLEKDPDHPNKIHIQALQRSVANKLKLKSSRPVWLKVGANWKFLTLCENGEIAQISVNGTCEKVILPAIEHISNGPYSNVKVREVTRKCCFYGGVDKAKISIDPYENVLLATSHVTSTLQTHNADHVLMVPLGLHLKDQNWSYAYSRSNDNSEGEQKVKALIDNAKFGVISLSGTTEKHYISALTRLLKHFEKNTAKLLLDGVYVPTFKRDGMLFEEKQLCAEIVEKGYVGCVSILDKLIAASKRFHGPTPLNIFCPDNETHTCAPMVFARFQLAGAFGDAALDWLYGWDAGHEYYCSDALNELSQLQCDNAGDFVEGAFILFWLEHIDGNQDDARQIPYFQKARDICQPDQLKPTLERVLRKLISRHDRMARRLIAEVRRQQGSGDLKEAIAYFINWSVSA